MKGATHVNSKVPKLHFTSVCARGGVRGQLFGLESIVLRGKSGPPIPRTMLRNANVFRVSPKVLQHCLMDKDKENLILKSQLSSNTQHG